MSRYRKSMKETLREVRGLIKEDATTSYPPKEINKKKHDAYKDPKKGEREIITKETSDPSVDDIAKGLKLDKKLVKKIMGEVFDYDEKVLGENVSQQIRTLKSIMAPMRGAKISIDGAKRLMDIMDKFDKKEDLIDLFKADIPFVSQSAAARLISKFRMSGSEINKLREEFGLDEAMYFDLDENQYAYTVVHVKHGKEVVKANSSYEAAKKYAQMKGLKSTAGVDAHLMEEVELDEKRIVLRPPINLIAKGEKPVKVKLDSKEYEMFMKKGYTRNEETIKEENIRVLVKDVKDRNFIKDLNNKAKELKVEVSEKGGRYIFSGEKMKVNDVFNFAFDKSIKRGNYDPATMMHEELDTDDKSVVKKVADKLAKASKAHAGQSKELKKAMTEKKSFTSQQIRQAYGIANDKRYKGGNLTGAVAAIEKIADGLSLHPDVLKVLQRTHEEVELSLAVESLFVSESSPNVATKNALAKLANQGGMDKRTYQKANMLYGRGDEPLNIRIRSLRKFIYDLDTEPREEIMKAINDNDKAFFKKMYPKARAGDYLSSISYQHRNEDFKHQGAREVVERLTGMKLSEISAKADKSLAKKAKATDIPKPILKKVYKRGMAAWGGGSRKGMKQQQWSHARVNSFIDKKPGTWGGADKDLAKKAKDAKKEEKKK